MGRPSRVRVIGPLEPYATEFLRELVRQGYTAHSASNQLQLMAHGVVPSSVEKATVSC